MQMKARALALAIKILWWECPGWSRKKKNARLDLAPSDLAPRYPTVKLCLVPPTFCVDHAGAEDGGNEESDAKRARTDVNVGGRA